MQACGDLASSESRETLGVIRIGLSKEFSGLRQMKTSAEKVTVQRNKQLNYVQEEHEIL
jgi:hypothetical protein